MATRQPAPLKSSKTPTPPTPIDKKSPPRKKGLLLDTSPIEKRLQDKIIRNEEPEPIEVVRAQGSKIFAADGKSYIDFVMGWNVGSVGWSSPEILAAIHDFQGPPYVSPHHLYKPWRELSDLLLSLAPSNLKKVLRATGGSEAVDLAIQAALLTTKRNRFLSVKESYHGNSVAGLLLEDPDYFEGNHSLIHVQNFKPEFNSTGLKKIEKILKKRETAALIMEPINLNLGVLIPEPGFMTKMAALCKRYGTLLIFDEVASAFWRTGKPFACQHYEIEPDIICVAKALTGGYAAMGAVLVTEKVASTLEKEGSFYSTYGWHPLSVAVSLAHLKALVRDRKEIEANIVKMNDFFTVRLQKMKFVHKPEIRVKGLAFAIDFKNAQYTEKLVNRARRKGLLIADFGDGLCLFPALNIDHKIAREGLHILARCV